MCTHFTVAWTDRDGREEPVCVCERENSATLLLSLGPAVALLLSTTTTSHIFHKLHRELYIIMYIAVSQHCSVCIQYSWYISIVVVVIILSICKLCKKTKVQLCFFLYICNHTHKPTTHANIYAPCEYGEHHSIGFIQLS